MPTTTTAPRKPRTNNGRATYKDRQPKYPGERKTERANLKLYPSQLDNLVLMYGSVQKALDSL